MNRCQLFNHFLIIAKFGGDVATSILKRPKSKSPENGDCCYHKLKINMLLVFSILFNKVFAKFSVKVAISIQKVDIINYQNAR